MSLAGEPCSHTGAKEALEAIGLKRPIHHLPSKVLSQGQKRRVALAKLWLSTRPVWLLDEPFTSLDQAAIGVVTQRLHAHLQRGGLAVVVTHRESRFPRRWSTPEADRMNGSRMWEAIGGIVRRDLLLAMRRRSDAAMSVFFLVIVVSLFPLGVGPEPAVLRTIGPGVLWVAALLACLLSLGRVFTADYLDGVLEQMVLIPQPLALLVVGKVLAHWVISGLPVVLLPRCSGSNSV